MVKGGIILICGLSGDSICGERGVIFTTSSKTSPLKWLNGSQCERKCRLVFI